mmetsp:Transcript_51016/g.119606  ORF Transcript_51016/g.119606 Transcript_51016/m.119606 type:complete len:386 (+) Transcript_51016:757-1914(+)
MQGRRENRDVDELRVGAGGLECRQELLHLAHLAVALPVAAHKRLALHAKRGRADVAEARARVAAPVSQLLLDAQELVVLCQPLRSARSSSLDLPCAEADHEIRDEGVLRLARSVGDHDTPASKLGHACCLDGLRHRPDLIHLQQQGIAGLAVQGLLHALGVGDQEVVSNNLDGLTHLGLELGVRLPVVLIKGILNGHERVLADPILVVRDHLLRCLLHTVGALGILEVQVVLLRLGTVKLRRRHIRSNFDLPGMARFLDRLHEHIKRLVVVLDAWRKTSFISNVAGILAVLLLDDALQVVVDLCTDDHGFLEGTCPHRKDHELLASQSVASMAAAVDDIERWDGHHEAVVRLPRDPGDILVEGHPAGSCACSANCHGHGQHSIGS